jgi:hypothetical protein
MEVKWAKPRAPGTYVYSCMSQFIMKPTYDFRENINSEARMYVVQFHLHASYADTAFCYR